MPRKPAAARANDLRLAMLRIKRGHSRETKISISAVAREAGVSAALIHNHYPAMADEIRSEQGRDGRERGAVGRQEFAELKVRLRDLRRESQELRVSVARLASINEVLLAENEALRSRAGDGKVVALRCRGATPT